jgi:hypothetical protein
MTPQKSFRGCIGASKSKAERDLARSWAFERAVKAGRGYYRVITEPDPDSDDAFDQRIIIKRILQQGSVVLDPFSQEPDYSDGQWAFLTNDMPWETYKRRYPKSQMASYTEDELSTVGTTTQHWVSGSEGAARAVRVAEYYRLEYETSRKVLLDDGSESMEDAIPEGRTAEPALTPARRSRRSPFCIGPPSTPSRSWNPSRRWTGATSRLSRWWGAN